MSSQIKKKESLPKISQWEVYNFSWKEVRIGRYANFFFKRATWRNNDFFEKELELELVSSELEIVNKKQKLWIE